MKVLLIKDARIKHKAGETVEVTPEEFNYLVSLGQAKPVESKPVESKPVESKPVEEKPKRKRTKK